MKDQYRIGWSCNKQVVMKMHMLHSMYVKGLQVMVMDALRKQGKLGLIMQTPYCSTMDYAITSGIWLTLLCCSC